MLPPTSSRRSIENKSVAIADAALAEQEANALFDGLEDLRGLILAVSGGPDSTALLVMAAAWAKHVNRRLKRAPKLIAVTIDHGLRAESRREAAAVKKLARRLGVSHRTVRWRGAKPARGLQEAARAARYLFLSKEAARAGFEHIVTAHTLDDQAETLLFRLARGSGLTGLAGMSHTSPLPAARGKSEILLVRPLLSVPKSRLIATLKAARVGYSNDPSNRDPRFTRTRLRDLLPGLAAEGLDAKTLARLGSRMRRAEAAIEFAVGAAHAALTPQSWPPGGPIVLPAKAFGELPHEVGLRLLGRAIAHAGDEGPVELGKLEVVYDSLRAPAPPVRRTLAGALISLRDGKLTIERAPPRRAAAKRLDRNKTFKK
jgi:tRNA(Ile)-lysidine synthase